MQASVVKGVRRDPREKFLELADKRFTRAIMDLRLIRKPANRRNYHYDDEDARKILRALRREFEILSSFFRGDYGPDGSMFFLRNR
jgi:hypothetical protein